MTGATSKSRNSCEYARRAGGRSRLDGQGTFVPAVGEAPVAVVMVDARPGSIGTSPPLE